MREKRIGILTYHRSHNYGAFMQAYSLVTHLQNQFPDCRIEIVDYISKQVYLLYNKSTYNFIKLIIEADGLRRKATFLRQMLDFMRNRLRGITVSQPGERQFKEALRFIPLSDSFIVTDNAEKVFDYIQNQYDIIIVGSDAVFNWQIRKFPTPYFLARKMSLKKMSYAASSYGQDYMKISNKQRQYVAAAWSDFDYLGVRDKPTEDIVNLLCNKECCHHNCDPTVFLDMEALPVDVEKLRDKLTAQGADLQRPIIGIMAQGWLAKHVRGLVGDQHQIISVFNYSEHADVNLLDITPFEWAAVFSLFDLTITHYFHGNMLSLKNGTPAIVVEQSNGYNEVYASKIRDFMERINMLDCCFRAEDLNRTNDIIKNKIQDILANHKSYCSRIHIGMAEESNTVNEFDAALRSVIEETEE